MRFGKNAYHAHLEEDREFEVAYGIWYEQRLLFSCWDCEPLALDSPENNCECTFPDYFIDPRWACIPCILAEERESVKLWESRTVAGEDDIRVSMSFPSSLPPGFSNQT